MSNESPEAIEAAFAAAVEHALGPRVRADPEWAVRLWCALANVEWRHQNGDVFGHTFRTAGHLVATIRGEGSYIDWYCSGPEGTVDPEIAAAMAKEGWTFEIM